MTPLQLFDLCNEACQRWENDPHGIRSDQPFVLLTIKKDYIPRGRTIRAFGKAGPLGTILVTRPLDNGGYDITCNFPAIPILQSLMDVIGERAVTIPISHAYREEA